MRSKPDWQLINKCSIWPILGVTECDSCQSFVACWGTDSQLPEPQLTLEEQTHWENTLKEIFNAR